MQLPKYEYGDRVTPVVGSHAGESGWVASWPTGQDGTYAYDVTFTDPALAQAGALRLGYREWELKPRG